MDIEFRNVSGSRVGFIIGNDIKDSNGNRVGMIVGNDIKDTYGNRVGILNGSDIKDISGNRVGMIIGNDIKDTYGNRVGYPISSASQIEMAAAGLLLFGLKPVADSVSNPINTSSSSDSYENSPQYESKAVSSGSAYDNIAQSLVSGMNESTLNSWMEAFRKSQESNEKYEEEQLQRRKENERIEKEEWKKKRKFVCLLGGLIGGLVSTLLPMLATDHTDLTLTIILVISIVSIFVFSKLFDSGLIGFIGGIILFFILAFALLGQLIDILPFKVLIFPIGFIIGALITLLITKLSIYNP